MMHPTVFVSHVVDAPIENVWRLVRDFNALPQWHPMIDASRIEGNLSGDTVGAVRDFTLVDGGRIREQLLAMSDVEHRISYSILEAPVAVENYVAELQFLPITVGNSTFGQWSADFDAPPEKLHELAELVGRIFRSGLEGIVKQIA